MDYAIAYAVPLLFQGRNVADIVAGLPKAVVQVEQEWLGGNSVQEDASVILTNNLLEMFGQFRRGEQEPLRAVRVPLPGGRRTLLPDAGEHAQGL